LPVDRVWPVSVVGSVAWWILPVPATGWSIGQAASMSSVPGRAVRVTIVNGGPVG
jgi:hypothetical protein